MADGFGCRCAARCESECGCDDVDWRSNKEIKMECVLAGLLYYGDSSPHSLGAIREVLGYPTPEEIKQKINKAFCPEKTIKFNPILEICKYIIFRERESFIIKRHKKYGGKIEFQNFDELEAAYKQGDLHPQDLKNAVAEGLSIILNPVRRYFANNRDAKECLKILKNAEITR